MDLTGIPLPENAPEPGTCVRLERPEAGLARIVLDPPHRPSLAVFDVPLMRDLDAALEEVQRDTSLRALVITGRSPLSFAGGADLDAIELVTRSDEAYRLGRLGQELFQRIHHMSTEGGGRLFTVAAVGGPVPGSACEMSLACDRILLVDHPKTRIGLPETMLGIVPGWGGCQRLPRRIGVPAALGAILAGKLYRPRAARRLGLVDRLTKPEYLERIAADLALGRVKCVRPDRGVWRWLVDRNPLAKQIIARQAEKGVLAKTKGHYPAPLRALALVVAAPSTPLEQGLENEARALGELAVGSVSKSLVRIFHLSEAAKKLGNLPDGEKAASITSGGVIGAGVMGGEIASLMAGKRISTRLVDLSREALDAAGIAHQKWVAKQTKRRRLERAAGAAALDRLELSTDLGLGFGARQFVIEAVAEKLAVKRTVLGALAESLPADALLATNTSSLSVAAIAEGLPGPERVVGVHFFNPVRKMPLVEIVRGPRTSDETVARAARYALDLGKTPVVVQDVAGFLVNRLLGPYLDEAVRLYKAGARPQDVDRALVAFGMPMGPFALLDEVGLDIASHAAESLSAAYGARAEATDSMRPLVESGDLGKKTGAGFYVWKQDKRGRLKNAGLNPALPGRATGPATSMTAESLADRPLLALFAEGVRSLEEGVVAGPRELDLATVFGMGFPPFFGGLLRWADSVGAAALAQRLARVRSSPEIEARGGAAARFDCPELLQELAASGRSFH